MTKVAITCDVGKGIEVVRCGSERFVLNWTYWLCENMIKITTEVEQNGSRKVTETDQESKFDTPVVQIVEDREQKHANTYYG